MLVSIAALFVVVYASTGSQLRGQIDRDLAGDTSQLARFLGSLREPSGRQISSAAGRYMRAQPYSGSSTLLFVLLPGAVMTSNHPEVFGAGREDVDTAAQRAKEATSIRALLRPRLGYTTQAIPEVGKVRVHERSVDAAGVRVIAGAGEPLASVERAQDGVAGAFLLAGALAIAFALIASYIAGARVSAPLRRMASGAARVDAGEHEPRIESRSADAEELRVLAQAFNHILDRLADAFASQRQFTADAAHELRTPLTVIRGQLEILAAQESPPGSEVRRVERLVQIEVTRISRLVDDLLLLARLEQPGFLHLQPIELDSFLTDLWDGITVLAPRRFELGPLPAGTITVDPDRLAQAVRNLATNAIAHTAQGSGVVRLEAERLGADRICLAVEDDGPGIPSTERQRVFERFYRPDGSRVRSTGGVGLGLAIVASIAHAHRGQARATQARNGQGARVELVLPGFSPRQAPTAIADRATAR